jgi:Cu/Ag efflux protein CusF
VEVRLPLGALVLLACRGEPPAAAPRSYTVRAEVVRLDAGGAAPRQVALRHEAIPEYADDSGAVVGMPAMVMSFDVAPAVPLEGLRAGDRIEADVAIGGRPAKLILQSFRPLPPGTPLRLQ